MPYYPYIPSGTFILEVNPSGATPLISGGYIAATGATGSGGIFAGQNYKTVDNFFFAHTTGADYLTTGNPTNIALATGTGYVYGGDIRGTGDNYQMWGTATLTGLSSQVEHYVGAYAQYTDAGGNKLTGLISGGNGFYTGSYTTLAPLQQFNTLLHQVDTGNLNHPSTGSGVHLFRDVTLTFSEIVDRAGATLETQDQLQNNLFFNGFDIDILNITGGMVFSGYKIGLKSRSFSFTEQENINVFGTYTSDFAVRYSLQDQNGEEQVNEVYLYGNPLEIDFLYITDASGRYLSQSNDSNFITTGSGSDELFLTNRQYVTGDPITGGINIEFAFKNDPNFTEYGNSVHVYGSTGSADFARNASNFIATIPLNPEKAGQTYELTPKDGDAEGLLTETDYYFQLEPESAISKGKVIKVGPHKIQPVEQDPRDAGQPLYNRGNQYLVGDLDVAGCVTGECLTISTATYPNTIETAGGNVGLGKVPGTAGSDPKLDINGRLQGVGAGGRVTGPGDVPYLLSGDAADSVTLQDVTDNGNTTTNDISCGTNTTPTAPVTIKTDASDHAGLDVYADGDLGNKILTLKADSSAAGEIIVKDTAGVDSVKLSNTSSRGQLGLFDSGGNLRGEMIVDSNNQGELTLKDSSANDSVKLTSDSNKRGNVNVYDAAGTIRVIMKADSNDKGQMSIKDDAGNESTKVQADKSVISAAYSNIYSTGSVIVGGSGHVISGDYDVIAGGAANQISGISGYFNFIGGGSGIDIEESTYASSVGGLNNDIITGDYSVIAGGAANMISGGDLIVDGQQEGVFNFIGGGSGIDIRESLYCCSVGGYDNDVKGTAVGVIGGGSSNRIEGELTADSSTTVGSFIGGGGINSILGATTSTIVGGLINQITGGGGSFIGGGHLNKITGRNSCISAGANNNNSGDYSSIGGGQHNQISDADYAFIGGGYGNKVSGDYSYALGHNALVASGHSGAAVLADGQDRTHTSSGENTLNLDFASGVYIGGGGALYVSGNPVMTGAHTVEADTLQDVTNRGNTTIDSIEVAGKFLSGVTGKFSRDLDVGTDPSHGGRVLSASSTNGRVAVGMNATDVGSGAAFAVYGAAMIGSSYAPYYTPPSEGLLVQGTAGFGTADTVNGAVHIYKNATINTITAPSAGGATLHLQDSSNDMYLDGNSILTNANSWISTSGSNYLAFGTNNTERIRIEGGGDIGIGTTNPSYCLEVTKSEASSLLSRFYNSSSTNGQGILVRAGETSNENRILQLASRDDTKVMTVNSNGKVGIGTTAPTQELDVRGTTLLSGQAIVDGGDGVASSATLHVRQKGDDDDDGIALTSSNATSHRIWKDSNGKLNIGPSSDTDAFVQDLNGNVGIGTNTPANALDVVGHFSATSKSFVIDHPTKENKKLQYGSLEGPEHGVFVRGTTSKNIIKLPDYWKDLVHEDSITVTLTPLHTFQSLYVKSKTPEQIMVGGVEKSYDYVVYGERKDIDKLEVEI